MSKSRNVPEIPEELRIRYAEALRVCGDMIRNNVDNWPAICAERMTAMGKEVIQAINNSNPNLN